MSQSGIALACPEGRRLQAKADIGPARLWSQKLPQPSEFDDVLGRQDRADQQMLRGGVYFI